MIEEKSETLFEKIEEFQLLQKIWRGGINKVKITSIRLIEKLKTYFKLIEKGLVRKFTYKSEEYLTLTRAGYYRYEELKVHFIATAGFIAKSVLESKLTHLFLFILGAKIVLGESLTESILIGGGLTVLAEATGIKGK